MGAFFIMTWRQKLSVAAERRAIKAIREIDDEMVLVNDPQIPGNATKCWLQRPNDGYNNSNAQRAANARAIAIVEAELNRQP